MGDVVSLPAREPRRWNVLTEHGSVGNLSVATVQDSNGNGPVCLALMGGHVGFELLVSAADEANPMHQCAIVGDAVVKVLELAKLQFITMDGLNS